MNNLTVIEFQIPAAWVACAMYGVAIAGLLFGIFTAVWPRQSMALYQWIMARFNWQVSPRDEAREVRNTRLFGILLISLSGLLLGILGSMWS